ncbi:MAG: hypothetical protein KGJ12_02890 [Gammaproteobacteria bacterium]|nr:hypothetical protein [Gammaproteobacteria bacterium]
MPRIAGKRRQIFFLVPVVSQCQYREGGLGRVSGALPTLADTWRALDVLHRNVATLIAE